MNLGIEQSDRDTRRPDRQASRLDDFRLGLASCATALALLILKLVGDDLELKFVPILVLSFGVAALSWMNYARQ